MALRSLVEAVRAAVAAKPLERGGWSAYKPVASIRHEEYYDFPSAWLIIDDVSIVGGLALTAFSWGEPETPALRYYLAGPLLDETDLEIAAYRIAEVVLRTLRPGWRNTVTQRWLSQDAVLIARPERRYAIVDDMHAAKWRGEA